MNNIKMIPIIINTTSVFLPSHHCFPSTQKKTEALIPAETETERTETETDLVDFFLLLFKRHPDVWQVVETN